MEREQSLSNIGNTNTSETLQAVDKNAKNIIQAGEDAVFQTVQHEVRRRPGLFGLMFPGKILRENDELTIQKMRDTYKSRQDIVKAYIDAQVELVKNQGQMSIKSKLQGYEGELSQQAMQIRTNLTEFSQRKLSEMTGTFEKSRVDFLERTERQLNEAEKYKSNTFLYNKLEQNLHKEIEVFFDTIADLLDGFTEALNNKLNQN
jgi:hypothetical protein